MLRPFARGLTPSLLPKSRNIAIFNVFAIKTKLWLVRSIINTESSETGSLIKIHCKLWEICEPNSPIFLNACQWTTLTLLAFLSKLANFYKTLQVYHIQYDEPICENKCYYYYYYFTALFKNTRILKFKS